MTKTKEEKYIRNIEAPIYVPNLDKKPDVKSLINDTKYKELVKEIDSSDIPNEEKEFLKLASSRQLVFNYKLIAEYYAHSDKKVQELMEKNALVIIDFNKAIEYGYVQLSKSVIDIVGENVKS